MKGKREKNIPSEGKIEVFIECLAIDPFTDCLVSTTNTLCFVHAVHL